MTEQRATASERLRELMDGAIRNANQRSEYGYLYQLLVSFPLIADVVEAAEVFWSDDHVDGMKATENLDAALTALREALEEK